MSRKLTLGILAHVDAGKTTLAEAMLYVCGTIRKLGRVDHQDAFLDTFSLERERGITIFSKQAHFAWKDLDLCLLDTPGHVDFAGEMERTLQVLDYAVLVINGADGVQGHTMTLWKLLKEYDIPTFLFINKMDQPDTDKEKLLSDLQKKLDSSCYIYGHAEEQLEQIAMCNEEMMDRFLTEGTIDIEMMARAVTNRQFFPCFFGSALKLEGVEELLDGMEELVQETVYPEEFGARVYKVTRDDKGNRLTHLKVTGGVLKAKSFVNNANSAAGEEGIRQEKVDQIRVYHGNHFELVSEVTAGDVCAVTGLQNTVIGEGLGYESVNFTPQLEPVLSYRIQLPDDVDPMTAYRELKKLEEEEPLLYLVWNNLNRQIHAMVMGEIQIQVLKSLIPERFGMEVDFVSGSVLYKETIAEPVIGYGHFEPLRHYAEVQLLMEPGEPGSGLEFASLCSEDILDKNWQRLIMTHLEEKAHVGVLMGGRITDMRISLIAGRAHSKHTEGGDFRQAVYRAVRQGLRSATNILLEPVFAFTLEVPTKHLGRAMTDIKKMQGDFEPPVTDADTSILTGTAPVSTMRDYQREVISYTGGFGRLSCNVCGYAPCHNTAEVLSEHPYDPEADLENPTGSVFCAHGAGFLVPWDQVPSYAHVDSGFRIEGGQEKDEADAEDGTAISHPGMGQVMRGGVKDRTYGSVVSSHISQEEIDAIFKQSYGKNKEVKNGIRRYHKLRKETQPALDSASKRTGTGSLNAANRETVLLVDGYNIIFAWQELKELSRENLDSARDRLMEICSNYAAAARVILILVFDAYKVKGNPGSVMKYHNIYVVYTKEAETADQYIEKTVHDIASKYRVTVATSDALEQMIIWGEGAARMSAAGLKEAVDSALLKLRTEYDIKDSE